MSTTCEHVREALSATADGEVAPVGEAAVRTHLDACAACTAFAAASGDLDRRVRVAPAEPVPDLSAAILAAVDTPDTDRARTRLAQVRGLLALVGVTQLLLAVPAMLGTSGLASHAAREAGIFEVALGIGFLVVARRPARAGGLLPVAAVVATLVTVASLGDALAGTASLVQEAAHLLEIIGTGLLWALDRQRGRAVLHPAAG